MDDKSLNPSQIKVLTEIRNNPNITKKELSKTCNLEKTSIDNIICIFIYNFLVNQKVDQSFFMVITNIYFI